MVRKTAPLVPALARLLGRVGENIRLARLRRRLQAKQVAERAGMHVQTLRFIERGASGVTIGAYAAVLHVLGLADDLALLGQSDPLGRRLQDAAITATLKPARRRSRRSPAGESRGR